MSDTIDLPQISLAYWNQSSKNPWADVLANIWRIERKMFKFVDVESLPSVSWGGSVE